MLFGASVRWVGGRLSVLTLLLTVWLLWSRRAPGRACCALRPAFRLCVNRPVSRVRVDGVQLTTLIWALALAEPLARGRRRRRALLLQSFAQALLRSGAAALSGPRLLRGEAPRRRTRGGWPAAYETPSASCQQHHNRNQPSQHGSETTLKRRFVLRKGRRVSAQLGFSLRQRHASLRNILA